ncbi:MAG: M61 family metallopeptidase [Bacteroidetes bacterium]|nr:M61 family metallopeptidase [Bacteroidota bacterium]
MRYIFHYNKPSEQFLDIDFIIEGNKEKELDVQLSAWRPGRYELANFAKNIRNWKATDENGNELFFKKVKKDLWNILTNGASTIKISYNYYAAELNGGSTWLDEKQLYVNPVNCCLFLPSRMDETCTIELKVPENYEVAIGLEKIGNKIFKAKDFHELADSPFIASPTLKHQNFECAGVNFHIWFQGLDFPDWNKLINDFKPFAEEQVEMFGDFPVKDFHFLFQILPYPIYHGVEHITSTVITLGPEYDIFKDHLYTELLGVSSHELFHVWNVKMIRPLEMMPYNFTAENYSRLGWVAEGFTTYYGDTMLFRSKVFSEQEFFKTFNQQLKKHFDNAGRFNLSVGDSSFDTWLDGYTPGIPHRKTSIYTEGCLVAFMLDVIIRRNQNNEKSLDDVMRGLYHQFAKSSKGFNEADVKALIETAAGKAMDDFFADYVYGTKDFRPLLDDCLDYLGLEITEKPSAKFIESHLGIKAIEETEKSIVKIIHRNSVAENSGMMINDAIVAVNGYKVNNNLNEWCAYLFEHKQEIELTVYAAQKEKKLKMEMKAGDIYFKNYELKKKEGLSENQKDAYKKWAGR